MVLCHNRHYTIRVDELHNGEIHYRCWLKPKSFLDKPCLSIPNGKCTESPGKDKAEFVFRHDGMTYSLERIVSKGRYAATHIFLEVTDRDNQKSTWKMEEMPLPRYLKDLL